MSIFTSFQNKDLPKEHFERTSLQTLLNFLTGNHFAHRFLGVLLYIHVNKLLARVILVHTFKPGSAKRVPEQSEKPCLQTNKKGFGGK